MYRINVNNTASFDIDKKDEEVRLNDRLFAPDIQKQDEHRWHIINNLRSYNVEIVSFSQDEKKAVIMVNGVPYHISAQDQFDLLLEQMGMANLNASKVSEIKAPMPGLVLKVFVKAGDEIQKGQNLFVLEAMKMENIIKSPSDASVKTVLIKPGDKIEKNQVLMKF